MKQQFKLASLTLSAVILAFGLTTGAAARCYDISAAQWDDDKYAGREIAEKRWEECAYRKTGRQIDWERARDKAVRCEDAGVSPYRSAPRVIDCPARGDRDARYLCTARGVVCF